MTLVSVVICTYNSADTLGAALDSAFDQSLDSDEYEVVLVNDGSTDHTPGVVEPYQEQHGNLRYMSSPINKGLPAASNRGTEEARGKYFVRLDADDTFHRDILSSCVGPLERDETDFVYCDRYEIAVPQGDRRMVRVEPFQLFNLIACGTMLRTDMLRAVGGYRDVFWEEYDLYLRYLQHSGRPPARLPYPLYYYSRHASSMTADTERTREGWIEMKRLWGEDVLTRVGWPDPAKEAQ